MAVVKESKRVTLVVGTEALARLQALAGGQRKVGQWLTDNVGQLTQWESDSKLVARMRSDIEALLRNGVAQQ